MEKLYITIPELPKDIMGIQEVFYKTWLETYPNEEIGITKGDIKKHFEGCFSEESLEKRSQNLSKLLDNQKFLVAKDGDLVVGVCNLFIREEYNQLQAIYILPDYQGRGIGQLFWKEALNFFDSKKDIIVQVATYNTQAITFYKKLGFIDNGKRFIEDRHRMPISQVAIPQMEMVLKK